MQSEKIRYLLTPKIFTSCSGESHIYTSAEIGLVLLNEIQLNKIAKILFPEADIVDVVMTNHKNNKKEAKLIYSFKFASTLI
jgi:hypothetical protein